MSSLSTVRFIAYQQPFKLLDIEDHELPKVTGQRVLCFLLAPITNTGHQDLALESPVHSIASGFPPVTLNFDISI